MHLPLLILIIIWAVMFAEGIVIAWLCVKRKSDRDNECIKRFDIEQTVEKLYRIVKEQR